MSGYPWTLLGVEPTNDQRAIRKAYAAKLRVTRPDEDPVAFQALVEARDFALRVSRYDFDDEPEEQEAYQQLTPVLAADGADINAPLPSGGLDHASVIMPDVSAEAVPDEEPSEVEQLLAEIGSSSPAENLPRQWAAVFDALEQTNLDDQWASMWTVLNRVVHDLRGHVGPIPDSPIWHVDADENAQARFGPFGPILEDLEGRFGFLRNDTVLLDYLDDNDARDLVNALTAVVGRPDPVGDARATLVNVERIHQEALMAAFGHDYEMLDYYDRACRNDKYPLTFSVPALLLGPFFALRHRLHVSAMLSAAAVVAFVWILVKNANGATLPYEPLAIGLYLITVFATALRWRRMRLTELSKKVQKLAAKNQDADTIRNALASWGQPALGWGWTPFVIFAAIKLVALLASANGPMAR